jgi:hypothetical protein
LGLLSFSSFLFLLCCSRSIFLGAAFFYAGFSSSFSPRAFSYQPV